MIQYHSWWSCVVVSALASINEVDLEAIQSSLV